MFFTFKFSVASVNNYSIIATIDGLIEGYIGDAIEVIQATLTLDDMKSGIEGVKQWFSCISSVSMLKWLDIKHTDKAIIRTAVETIEGHHAPETLERVISTILLQRGLKKWQDDTREHLERNFVSANSELKMPHWTKPHLQFIYHH